MPIILISVHVKNGIYVLNKQNLYLKPECLSKTVFAGFDPGRNKPISACVIDGSDIPIDWKDEKRIYTLDKALDKNYYIDNNEYRTATGSIQQELYEKERRQITCYRKAVSLFDHTICKSAIIHVNETYYEARLTSWAAIRREMYHRSRLCYRFTSFRTRQQQIARFAKKLVSSAVSQSKDRRKKLVLLFGDGSFRPGGSGYASVPRKPFIRELGIRCPTIITNEFRTSKISPINFKDLTTSLKGNRIRVCKTNSEVSDVSCAFSADSNVEVITTKHRDRDAFGSVAICQKGIYSLIQNPIPFYERTFTPQSA